MKLCLKYYWFPFFRTRCNNYLHRVCLCICDATESSCILHVPSFELSACKRRGQGPFNQQDVERRIGRTCWHKRRFTANWLMWCLMPNPHAADADATQLFNWVASAMWTHPSAVVTQFTISRSVELLRLVISDDIMTSLTHCWKKLSISIKMYAVKRPNRYVQFPNCRPNPSAVVMS